MSTRMKLYIKELIDDEALERLRKLTDFTDDIKDADIVLTRNLRVNQKFLDEAKNLKLIAIHGTGISEVDVKEARRRGITVFNAPYQNVEAVAEMNLGLSLLCLRHLGKRSLNPKDYCGRDLKECTVGILGLGHIGRRTHELFKSMGCSILSYDRKEKEGISISSMDFVLESADVLVLSLALCDETRNVINEEKLKKMKKNVIIINTARGGLVDEMAMKDFLLQNENAIYASDVFQTEPLEENNPLLALPNVIAFPHVAANTKDALYAMGKMTVDGIEAFILGKEVKNRL